MGFYSNQKNVQTYKLTINLQYLGNYSTTERNALHFTVIVWISKKIQTLFDLVVPTYGLILTIFRAFFGSLVYFFTNLWFTEVKPMKVLTIESKKLLFNWFTCVNCNFKYINKKNQCIIIELLHFHFHSHPHHFSFDNIREEKGQKGHHHKEDHEGEYDEKKGHKKKHHDDSGWDFWISFITFINKKNSIRTVYSSRVFWW